MTAKVDIRSHGCKTVVLPNVKFSSLNVCWQILVSMKILKQHMGQVKFPFAQVKLESYISNEQV